MGGFFLAAVTAMNTMLKYPESLIFDNAEAVLRVREKNGEEETIPYGEIVGFHVRLHESNSSGGYMVEMEKRDGAFWTLFYAAREKNARAFYEALTGTVRLGAGSAGDRPSGPVPVPDGVSCEEEADLIKVNWRKKLSLRETLTGYLAIFFMALFIYGAGPHADNMAAYYAASVFMVVVCLMALGYLLFMVRRRYYVEITPGEVRYYSRGLLMPGRRFVMPVAELHAVIFNFSLSFQELALFFLRREEMTLFQNIRRGNLDPKDLVSALKLSLKANKVDLSHLRVGKMIALERYLQDLIERKTSRTDL